MLLQNFFSHITCVTNKNFSNFGKKKYIKFYGIKNPVEKRKFYFKYQRDHTIILQFKNKFIYREFIKYKKIKICKQSMYRLKEDKKNIKIFSLSPDYEGDMKLFKTFLKLKKRKNYYFINRENIKIRFFKSKNKNYNKQYLENSGLNILAFIVKNIDKVFKNFKKLKLNMTDIFEVNLIKKNKIFFAKFPSGIIVEFIKYQ